MRSSRYLVALWFSTCCLNATQGTSQVKDQNETEPRVAGLVRQLGSPSYLERKAAGQHLATIGSAGRQALEEAALSDDPEVRLRAAQLLDQLQIDELWAPGRVCCSFASTPASDALAELARQSGNHLAVGDPYGAFENPPIDLHEADGSFWPVLDELCRRSGNRVRLHYDNRQRGLVVVAGDPGAFPTAYSGPLRGQVLGALRTDQQRIRFADGERLNTHSFELDVQVLWEDRLRLIAFRAQPEVAEAVTDCGTALTAAHASGSGWTIVNNSIRQMSTKLSLTPPPIAATHLERLVLRWPLIAVGQMHSLTLDQPAAGAVRRQDGIELSIDALRTRDREQTEVTLTVARNRPVAEPEDAVFQEYRVELHDDQGRVYRLQEQSHVLTERGAQMRLRFLSVHEDSRPARLSLSYPQLRSQRDLEIVFRNIPLPDTRPR